MPVSEGGHADQQHSVKNVTTNQLIQAFSGEHHTKRSNDQASATDRSNADQYTDHKAYQRYLPSRQPVLGNKYWTTNWMAHKAPDYHAQRHNDESSTQQTHDHVIHDFRTGRSFQKG